MNYSATSQQLLQNKKEMFHQQIRKEKREEIFKQKRIIQKMNETNEELIVNPENLEHHITLWMKECISIYNQKLPNKFDVLLNNMKKLRKLQQLDQRGETFIWCLFENDFIEFLIQLLKEPFDAFPYLQVDATTILANFFGLMNKSSKYYFPSYIPLLNLEGQEIVKNIGRLLEQTKDNSLIDACLYALGNLFSDQDILVQQYKQLFGFNKLLDLSYHLNTLVWVLDTLTSHREYFTKEQLNQIIQILDSQLLIQEQESFAHSLSAIRNICEYILDAIPLIIQMKSFRIILEIIQQKQDQYLLHQTAIEILFSLTVLNDFKLLQSIENQHNLIDLCVTFLSSASKYYRNKSLIALTNLCDNNEIFALKLVEIKYSIEKIICITSQTEQVQVVNGLRLIKSILNYRNIGMNQLFINNKVINLLSATLEYLHDEIIMLASHILMIILETIDRYSIENSQIPGTEQQQSKVFILNQLNTYDIKDKLVRCHQNVNNQETQETLLECIDCLETIENEMD